MISSPYSYFHISYDLSSRSDYVLIILAHDLKSAAPTLQLAM